MPQSTTRNPVVSIDEHMIENAKVFSLSDLRRYLLRSKQGGTQAASILVEAEQLAHQAVRAKGKR